MQDFRINQISERAYHILDAGESSFYVVEGTDRAAVIDTGITVNEKIMPVIRELTDKPLLLVVTHAHGDHFYHMDEFDTVYLCRDDLEVARNSVETMCEGKQLTFDHTIDMQTDTTIGLGSETLEICKVPGHSPGSVAVLAQKRQLLFTGDAIGSGYGVWMQVPGALPLVQYRDSLIAFMKWLVDRGGRMKFWGGHSMQQFQSTLITNYNPLSMGLLADLIDLVDQVVEGQIVGRPSNADKVFDLEPTLYASYGRAELQYLQSRIR